jgi:predicted nucleic acid-binding protein
MGSFTGETLTLKILLDTNVILDVALQRQPYYNESDQVLSLVEQGELEGYISAIVIFFETTLITKNIHFAIQIIFEQVRSRYY